MKPPLPTFNLQLKKNDMRSILLILAMLTAGCAGKADFTEVSDLPVVQNSAMPAPTSADLISATRPYLIGPFDKLSIDVFGIDDLSREELQADASGNISFPLIGVVEASGLTPGQLAERIEQGLRGRYVRNPQVSVNLKETVSQVVTVDGQVTQPGLYPVIGRMTLMRAVATSGGVAEYADLEDVVVFRTVDGQRMAGLYNLQAIRRGAYDDPEIFANDIVVVGDSKARRRFQDLLKAAPLLSTPLLILFRR